MTNQFELTNVIKIVQEGVDNAAYLHIAQLPINELIATLVGNPQQSLVVTHACAGVSLHRSAHIQHNTPPNR
jgi:hypothetical protein